MTSVLVVTTVLAFMAGMSSAQDDLMGLLNPCAQRNCLDMIDNPENYLPNRTTSLDQVCGFKTGLDSCLAECGPEEAAMSTQYLALLDLLGYVCDASRRDLMERMVAAPCFEHEEEMRQKGQLYTMRCMRGFLRNSRAVMIIAAMEGRDPIQAMCPSLMLTVDCVAQRLGAECGDFLVDPLQEMVMLVMNRLQPEYAACVSSALPTSGDADTDRRKRSADAAAFDASSSSSWLERIGMGMFL